MIDDPAITPTDEERPAFLRALVPEMAAINRIPGLSPAERHATVQGLRAQILHILRNPDDTPAIAAAAQPLHTFTDGGVFIFDRPDIVPAVWGDGKEVLWAEGEALMLVGPSGVGKTTLANQVVAGLLGVLPAVLGYPVIPTPGRVLYLAMDRPQQIARSLKRVFLPEHRKLVSERLVVMQGPPPGDLAKNPHILADLCKEAGASVVIIDSLKDAAIGLSEDAVGAGYNSARQRALANGVQVLELHHQVKRGENGKKPTTLADVYGSAWITGGAGSVVLLYGQAGDPVVELLHLKQPAEPIGPFKVIHDHDAGLSTVVGGGDPLEVINGRGSKGTMVRDVAQALFGSEGHKLTSAELEKTRRKLNGLEKRGLVKVAELPGEGLTPAKVYYPSPHAHGTPTHPPRTPFSLDPPREDDAPHETAV